MSSINKGAYIQEVREEVVHEALESGGGIGKSKRHDTPFEKSVVSAEGGLPFVTLLDLDKVISVL